jgi:hypothetical protein
LKIAVAIPSYWNPAGLIAGVKNLHDLAAHPENLTFRIGLDFDDGAGHEAVKHLGFAKVEVVDFPHGMPHSEFWNKLCVPDAADYYVLYSDDAVCLTPHWDVVLAETANPMPFWNVVNQPGGALACFVSNAWLKTCGYALPPYFPFWFGDTWIDELRAFVTGRPSGIVPELKLYLPQGKTTGMKDLDYWWGFFNATRPLRIQKAWKIFNGLPLAEESFMRRCAKLSEPMRMRDAYYRARITDLEAGNTEPGEAKLERHRKCRALADALMQENGLELWGDI